MAAITLEDGLEIFYAEANPSASLPLLLVHGSGGSHRRWAFQIRGLGEGPARVIVPDLPGHGRSGGSPLDSIPACCAVLYRFVRALNLPPFVLGGHSLGGGIALEYALQHPGDLRGLILVGTGARLRVLPAVLETLRRGEFFSLTGYAYSETADPALLEAGKREDSAADPAVYLADLTACDRFDRMESLPLINTPALIITGTGDRLTPLKYARHMRDRLPRAELLEVEGAGHMVMIEQPVAVNSAITSFCLSLA